MSYHPTLAYANHVARLGCFAICSNNIMFRSKATIFAAHAVISHIMRVSVQKCVLKCGRVFRKHSELLKFARTRGLGKRA